MNTLPPDYAGGGLVNLMRSIADACGGPALPYPPASLLPTARLAEARHVVLLLIDGLGARSLARHGGGGHLQRHQIGELSSVFPSTTASAVTTVMTGLAPAQHGLTGWHMHLAEIGQTLSILPLTPRLGAPRLSPEELPPRLFSHDTIFSGMTRQSWVVAPASIAGSPFNRYHARGARSLAYTGLPGLCATVAALLRGESEGNAPKYIYAYFPDLDSTAHRYGIDSSETVQVLGQLDAAFGALLADAVGSDAWVLATADHGFIDSPPEREVCLDDHPQLAALLERPLCGERRAAYCYVEATKRPAFEAYVREKLGHCTDLQRSEDLVAAGWFGPPPAHRQLSQRIGDYTLVMKENWTIKDWLPGEKRYRMLGVHGGVSADEMTIPLIAARI